VEEKRWRAEADSARAAATPAKNYSLEELVVERPLALRTFRRKWNPADLSRRNVGNSHRSSQVTLKLPGETEKRNGPHTPRTPGANVANGRRVRHLLLLLYLGEFSTRNENQSDPTKLAYWAQ
jgi:hypothetical protein